MRLLLISAVLLCARFVFAADSAPADELCDIRHAETIELGKASLGCGHALSARPDLMPDGPGGGPRGPGGGTDVTHYSLRIEILPQYDVDDEVVAVAVDGSNTINVTVLDAPRNQFTIDLSSNMNVASVTGNVSGWTHVADEIQVTLDRTYNPGEQFTVTVAYNGLPDALGLGAFKWWERAGNLCVATLSEPYFAPQWWPCKDTLDDKATIDIAITVPDPLVGVSNGTLVQTTPLGDGRTRYQWQSINPMTSYLASLAITNYQRYDLTYEYDDGNGGTGAMPVPCYLFPDHWDFGMNQPNPPDKAGCDEMLVMLGVFEDLFGPYPFRNEKYGVAETGGTAGLQSNMEHQTISSMYRVQDYSDIMAHEMAHHWFGDNITCETWHDIWLNEGLTSYLEALYREFRPGGGMNSYWSRMNQRRPSNPDARVYRNSIASVGAIFSTNDIYNKGAWVAHMLRHVMGDAAFFSALADYRAAFSVDYATTSEFTASMSASFGHDLSWFVNEWVMNPGAPDYNWRVSTDVVNGTNYVKLEIRQLQNGEGFGLVTMPIDIRITTAGGSTVHRVWNNDWTDRYVLPVNSVVTNVEFDEAGGVGNRNYVLASTVSFDAAAPVMPPVVVETRITPHAPTPGQSLLRIYFSENIGSFDASDAMLVGAATGTHAPLSVSYNGPAREASLTFANLPNDNYTLTLFASGIMANGFLLDGEIDDSAWYDDRLLPSGDGQPGGDAAIDFALLAGDANCDEVVNISDLTAFIAVLLGNDTNVCHVLRSDMDNSGTADGADIAAFVDSLL